MATLKGQNFRILTKSGDKFQCVGMATNCTVTLTGNTDDASTKDDLGGAQKPTITSKSWSVSVESLSVADVATILTAVKNNTKYTYAVVCVGIDGTVSAKSAARAITFIAAPVKLKATRGLGYSLEAEQE